MRTGIPIYAPNLRISLINISLRESIGFSTNTVILAIAAYIKAKLVTSLWLRNVKLKTIQVGFCSHNSNIYNVIMNLWLYKYFQFSGRKSTVAPRHLAQTHQRYCLPYHTETRLPPHCCKYKKFYCHNGYNCYDVLHTVVINYTGCSWKILILLPTPPPKVLHYVDINYFWKFFQLIWGGCLIISIRKDSYCSTHVSTFNIYFTRYLC